MAEIDKHLEQQTQSRAGGLEAKAKELAVEIDKHLRRLQRNASSAPGAHSEQTRWSRSD